MNLSRMKFDGRGSGAAGSVIFASVVDGFIVLILSQVIFRERMWRQTAGSSPRLRAGSE
jgi:hypothetical protein